MSSYAFGIDIGGTTVKMGFFEGEGTLVKQWEIPTRKEDGGKEILPDVANALMNELKERAIPLSEVKGIGIGVPGAVLNESTVNRCANLGWGLVNVAEEMKKLTGIDNIKIGNDANVAALGEMWKGGGSGYNNLVMVTLGTGVGGGIIINGKIVAGLFGAGGEIGHMTVSKEETAVCGCGKRGHLEQYASATGIVRTALEVLARTDRPTVLKKVPHLSAKEIFDAAKNGDPISMDIIDSVGDILGMALSNISCVIDPEIYVIGGGVSKAGDILIDAIKKHYEKYAFHASENTEIKIATLGNDAGMYGAVKMVL